jgi:hypothetical protein
VIGATVTPVLCVLREIRVHAGWRAPGISTDVAESHWGTLVPMAAATNETNQKMSRDKFITCVFLAEADTKKYGRLKTKLNNAYVAGQNNYTKTVEGAVTMLPHYIMNNKGVHMTDEDKGQTTLKSFMVYAET